MKLRNQWMKYGFRDQASSDGGDGGSGATYTEAQFQEKLNSEVSGLKTKNSDLIAAEKAAKQRATDAENKLSAIDWDLYNSAKQQMQDEQREKIIKSEGFEGLEKRQQQVFESQKQQIVDKYEAEKSQLLDENKQLKALFVNAEIKEQARKAGVVDSAVLDALLHAERVFELKDGLIQARELIGKDNQPLTAGEWFEQMRQKAPHWFPASTGGGTTNNRYGGGKSFSEMSEQERVALHHSNPTLFKQLQNS